MAPPKYVQKYLGHLQIPRLMKKHLKIFALPSTLYLYQSYCRPTSMHYLRSVSHTHTHTLAYNQKQHLKKPNLLVCILTWLCTTVSAFKGAQVGMRILYTQITKISSFGKLIFRYLRSGAFCMRKLFHGCVCAWRLYTK